MQGGSIAAYHHYEEPSLNCTCRPNSAIRTDPAPPQPFLVFSRDLLPTSHGWPIISLRLMDNFEPVEKQFCLLKVIQKASTRRENSLYKPLATEGDIDYRLASGCG